jgi:endonuclease YncB( thermonuclease family)
VRAPRGFRTSWRPTRRGRAPGLSRLLRRRRVWALLAAILALPSGVDYAVGAGGGGAGCRLAKVVDGDTVALRCPGEGLTRARLVGFDTPEIFSPGCAEEWLAGQAATLKLRSLLWSADRREWRRVGTDRYDRALVRARLDGRDVAALMIASGHARAYEGGRRAGWCGRA